MPCRTLRYCRLLLWALTLLVSIVSASPTRGDQDDKDKRVSVAASETGFAQMFDGRDLAGWQTTGNWQIEQDGTVALHPRPGEKGWRRFGDYLTTTKLYGDFILELDFKINAQGNSGVFLRVGDPQDQVKTGVEVQILDTYGKQNPTHHDCGGIVNAAAPTKNMVKPVGKWNHYRITCRGNHLQVALNGQQVVDLALDMSTMKDRPKKGYISFQDEGKSVWYRNVRIKELSGKAGY